MICPTSLALRKRTSLFASSRGSIRSARFTGGMVEHPGSTQNREHGLQNVLKGLARDSGCCGGCNECLQVLHVRLLKWEIPKPLHDVLGQMTLSGTYR